MKTTDFHPACVLWGGYTFGNTGDELTLAVALHDARQRFGDAVAVLSRDPAYTRWLFPDVHVLPYESLPPVVTRRTGRVLQKVYALLRRRGLVPDLYLHAQRLRRRLQPGPAASPAWVRAIEQCREFYLVGGGYLTDLFDVENYLLPLQIANARGIPIATAPLGLGPFTSERAAAAVAQALRRARVAVRDTASLDFCHRHGIAGTLRPDDGFRLLELMPELALSDEPEAHASDAAPRRARVGICIFHQHGSGEFAPLEEWWTRFLRILKRHDAELSVEGFHFHTARNRGFATMVHLFHATGLDVRCVQAPCLDFREAIRKVRTYDVVVSTRFHAVVVANVLNVPHVAVAAGEYYTNKMLAALGPDDTGSRLVTIPEHSPEEAANHVLALCRRRELVGL